MKTKPKTTKTLTSVQDELLQTNLGLFSKDPQQIEQLKKIAQKIKRQN